MPIFAGGFINFGYWQAIELDRPLDETARIRSQEDLYGRVLEAAGLPGARELLEVGCGLGMGCASALREYGHVKVTGMDIHPDQLRRARDAHADLLRKEPERLRFVQGAAERMPLADGEFDAVISVEAAQHFPDLDAFAAQTARVLRPGGRRELLHRRRRTRPARRTRRSAGHVRERPGHRTAPAGTHRRDDGGRAHGRTRRVDRTARVAGLGPLAQPVVGPGHLATELPARLRTAHPRLLRRHGGAAALETRTCAPRCLAGVLGVCLP
ncbi:class I SAM-dependent methyltransferase [Streptomyces sp. MUSC 14]|uniref:class I SAM-dependent methyltransferase n=1 Tax=Streptomyces sp. MUSC 14 TaxID=1354889 RepID=UPI00210D2C76|nr:class I SAM-dependent methyltransferase [Streptomyces sp. MUSC 14]